MPGEPPRDAGGGAVQQDLPAPEAERQDRPANPVADARKLTEFDVIVRNTPIML